MYYTDGKSSIHGSFEIRYRKNGRPFVSITRREADQLASVSKKWKIEQDVIDESVYIKPDRLLTSRVHRQKTKVTTIRVNSEDWDEYVKLCKDLGTSTCREIRLFIHLKLEEARYPATTRRFPGVG
jgi:hypothetical protein